MMAQPNHSLAPASRPAHEPRTGSSAAVAAPGHRYPRYPGHPGHRYPGHRYPTGIKTTRVCACPAPHMPRTAPHMPRTAPAHYRTAPHPPTTVPHRTRPLPYRTAPHIPRTAPRTTPPPTCLILAACFASWIARLMPPTTSTRPVPEAAWPDQTLPCATSCGEGGGCGGGGVGGRGGRDGPVQLLAGVGMGAWGKRSTVLPNVTTCQVLSPPQPLA